MKQLLQRVARLAGELMLAIGAGGAVYVVAWKLDQPDHQINPFSVNWARMAEQPFDAVGQFPQRMLAPLLAHVFGFGSRWHAFTCVLGVVFLSVLFLFCRARGARIVDALLVTLAIGISGAIQVYKDTWPGYPDHLGFALLLLCALAARNGWVFWTLHLANLLTHEVAFFWLPWLLFVRRQNRGSVNADLVGLLVTTAAYVGFRQWIGAHAQEQVYNVGFFAKNNLFPQISVWLVVLLLEYLVITYGPLFVVVGWHQRGKAFGKERLELWLILACILCIFLFAYDFNRHGNALLIPIAIASIRFLQAGHRLLYAGFVAGIVAMVWIFDKAPPWLPQIGPQVNLFFMGVTVECELISNYKNVFPCAIPKAWPAIVGVVAAFVVEFWIGAWLRRRDERRGIRPDAA